MDRLSAWWRRWPPLHVAVVVLAALTLLSALGSLFPAMPANVVADSALRHEWLQRADDSLGPRAGVYDTLGLFEPFRSVWFWVIVGLAALITADCTFVRLRATLGHIRPGRRRWFLSPSLWAHCGALLAIAGLAWSTWGTPPAETLVLTPGAPVAIAGGPRTLRLDASQASHYPSGELRDYAATIIVLTGDVPLESHVLRVNHPFHYAGDGYYLKSYGADYTEVEVRDDSGFPPAIMGGALLLLSASLLVATPGGRRGAGATGVPEGGTDDR